jgi:hypothetical protein
MAVLPVEGDEHPPDLGAVRTAKQAGAVEVAARISRWIGSAGRGWPAQAAARRAGLELVENVLTAASGGP